MDSSRCSDLWKLVVSCVSLILGIVFAVLVAHLLFPLLPGAVRSVLSALISIFIVVFIVITIRRWRRLFPRRRIQEQETNCSGIGSGRQTNGAAIADLPGTTTAFTYKALAEATDGFRTAIGSGGFGRVYKGILADGTAVAVKCLLQDGDHESFQAEVSALAGLNHTNLVQLIGVCADPCHRILVYEFMQNSSLDGWIFSTPEHRRRLDWKTRRFIALGAAKGLAYLHDDSRSCVLHLDIKPQNILLNDAFQARIADFGLAKTLRRDFQSRWVASGLRGTPGYMAPEWIYNVSEGVTAKSDVFSFGLVVLEMVCGRRCVENGVSGGGQSWYLPSLAFQKAREGSLQQMPDPAVEVAGTEEMEEIILPLMKIGLWCVQGDPFMRPTMSTVVSMIQGDVAVNEPPLHSNIPYASSFAGDASLEILSSSACVS